MTQDVTAIIRKCTRNGYTSWFNAAKMLGMTQEKARALYQGVAKETPQG